MQERSRDGLAALLVLGLVLPFLGRPVHVDEANFLRLAAGARADPWRPHAISINWQGVEQPALEVLSNPPGIAWWLAVLPADAPAWLLHAWMLPWLALALWGIHRLGNAVSGQGRGLLLLLGTSPIVVLSAQSLTPDLPLLACTVAGIAGFLTSARPARWAFLVGCASLFRYSGICLVPLLLLAGWQRHRWKPALASALPLLLLLAHDAAAYGELHLFSMVGFQSVADTPGELWRKAVASAAMLGGAGLLPFLARGRPAAIGAAIGALAGGGAAVASGHQGIGMAATVLATAAGGATLSSIRWRDSMERWLACWALGGLLFLLALRFVAARYWIPFLPAYGLFLLRLDPSPKRLGVAVAAASLLGLGMSWDMAAMARGHAQVAGQVAAFGTGAFSGHWGWQHHLEAAGWKALDEGNRPTGLYAVSQATWPQEPAPGGCLDSLGRWELEDTFWGPRVHTATGAANYHANLVSHSPPVETYSPWSLSNEPYDVIELFGPCP